MALAEKKISPKKLQELQFLKDNIQKYNVVGLVSMEKIDARSITKLRKALRGKVVMRMSKKRLIKRALADFEGKKKFGQARKRDNRIFRCNIYRHESYRIIELSR